MARSRKALKDTLLALLEEERPFEQITIREITGKAGVGYATFFRHYPTKEKLLNALASKQVRELLEITYPILSSSCSKAAVKALCTYVNERSRLWNALLASGAANRMKEEFIHQTQGLAAMRLGSNSWVPDDLRLTFGVGVTIDILAWWLPQRESYSVDQIAEYIDRLAVAPAMTNLS